MRHTIPFILVLAVACGVPGTPSPQAGLAYAVSGPEPVTYSFTDSMGLVIQAGGMGDVTIHVAYSGMARVALQPGAGDFLATLEVLAFDGGFSNPMAGSVTATASDIGGPIQIRLSPRGETEVVEAPSVTDAFDQVAGIQELVRGLFVRLPGTPVEIGDTWTDTIRSREETGETLSISQSILTATAAGDTTLDGRTLRVVETSYENTLNLSGTSGGTRVSQRLSGTTTGTFFWDVARTRLVQRRETGSMTGTLSLPDMGIDGIPVEANLVRRVRLEP